MTGNNLRNLINSADIGTIFLDRGFRVQLFTPAARAIFNLIPADIGRALSDITNRLADDGILADAETVLENLTAVERQVRTTEGRVYMMRVLPYRTADDRIQGTVATFFDITDQKRAEDALRVNEERARGQKEAFKAAINGAALEDSLKILSRVVRPAPRSISPTPRAPDCTRSGARATCPNPTRTKLMAFRSGRIRSPAGWRFPPGNRS